MWKDKKFIILASALAAVLVIGATAGVVLAQAGDNGTGKDDGILPRVAQILGIDQQKLTDAFTQARTEYREQHPRGQNPEQGLEKAVQNSKLTQQQADQVKAWWASKPANPKDNPEQFKEWLNSRPDVPMTQPHRSPGPGGFPGRCSPNTPAPTT
jgi:hypothetical protein